MKTLSKRTKIVCTIGPATDTVRDMVALGNAGMDVARMNFSHGTFETHGRLLTRLRQAGRQLERPFAILQDLQGPKIRVGDLPPEGVMLRTGGEVVFSTASVPAGGDIPVTLAELHRDVKRGEHVLLDDGLLECVVRRVDGHRVHCEVVTGGKLTSHKGLNLPGTRLKIPALSDKDRADAAWGVAHGVDYVAMSFIRTPQDVKDLRTILNRTAAGRQIKVVGKIEKQEAVDDFENILELLDVVMVARGDLGIESPAANVPVIQKQLIASCRAAGKPVIVATQMLDSMIRNPRPTRAEVSDIANAVTDHADAVMLSGETASGAYPIQAVRVMSDTIRATEGSPFDDLTPLTLESSGNVPELIGATVRIVSDALGHAPIVALTASGRTARLVSSFRPETRVLAITSDPVVYRQMRLMWGVEPWLMPWKKKETDRSRAVLTFLKHKRALRAGERVIVASGLGGGASSGANSVEILKV